MKKWLSMFLIAAMLLTMLPAAFAEELDGDIVIVEEPTEDYAFDLEDSPEEEPAPASETEASAAADILEEEPAAELKAEEAALDLSEMDESDAGEPEGESAAEETAPAAVVPVDDKLAVKSGTFETGVSWTLDANGRLTITGNGEIPDFDYSFSPWFDGYSLDDPRTVFVYSVSIGNGITRIGNYAFYSLDINTPVVIPDSVTSIGEFAFTHCTKFTSVSIPNSVTSIERQAFTDTGLTSLTLPDSVTNMGNYTFSECHNLKTVKLPAKIKVLPEHLFDSCTSLDNVTIPNSVTTIQNSAFSSCKSLKSITIPDGVTSIGRYAFAYCESLTDVKLGKGMKEIPSDLFRGCSSLSSITIPNHITSIGSYAFGLTNLQSVTIPSSVKTIERGAFSNCPFESISFPNTVTKLEGCLCYCENLKSVKFPSGMTTIPLEMFRGCTALEEMTVPDNVESIGGSAFAACSNLKKVTLPESVKYIDRHSFEDCVKLTSINIPEKVENISYVFINCKSLKSIMLPKNLKELRGAFEGCSALESIVIPRQVEDLGSFSGCTSLKEIYFCGDAPQFYYEGFINVTATARYPGSNESWTAEKLKSYGGKLTWVPYTQTPAPVMTEAFNSAKGVRVSWKPVSGAVAYQLLRKNITYDTAWKIMGETTDCSLIDTTVWSGSAYTFTVRAVNADGTYSAYDTAGRSCTYIGLANVQNLRYGIKGVTVTWSKPNGAKNFRVMRREDGTSTWKVLAVVQDTTYTDTTAKIGTKYWYTVRCVSMDNKVVTSSYNATGWSIRPVSAPVLTEAFNSATGVRVSWKPVDGAVKYRLMRKNLTLGETQWKKIGETTDCTLIDTMAKSSNRYTYTVECVDSNEHTCSTSDSTGRTCTFIAMPKITSVKSVSNGVALEWSKPDGAKNFRVFRKTDGGSWVKLTDIQGTSYTDTTAKIGVKYWYTVRAITLAGNMYISSYNATGWSVTRQ